MTRNEIIQHMKVWIEDDPSETAAPFIDLDGRDYSLQDLLMEIEKDTEIGKAFVVCYDDVLAGVI